MTEPEPPAAVESARTNPSADAPPGSGGLERRITAFQATALNMAGMVGIGPFITIPLMVSTFGGPQAIVGFAAGALLALCDGLGWAELSAAMPGAGGAYIYHREAFQYRTGKLMPFMIIWTTVLGLPLVVSTGVIGIVQYLGFLWPSMTTTEGTLVGLAVIAFTMLLLWRRVGSVARLTVVMWAVMVVAVAAVLVAAFVRFDPSRAFTYPPGAFDVGSGHFWSGVAGGLGIAVYDYMGYNNAAVMGAEVARPGRSLPKATVASIIGVMGIYLLLQIGALGALDWHRMLDPDSTASKSVASAVVANAWGPATANAVTVLILVTAFASVFVGTLTASRTPYQAALDGLFLRSFARLHPRHRFPLVGQLAMGLIMAAGFLVGRYADLNVLIQLLVTAGLLVGSSGSVSQTLALFVLRRRQPALERPYRMWLYPLPALVALVTWLFMFAAADHDAPGAHPVEWSVAWLLAGCAAFLAWSRRERVWPFGTKSIEERYLVRQERARSS
ncbi:APC family permease [Streptomyces sp. RB6PN25]|uniref:APC family permease n=1 Tax=Streptomyces humicola TaxID=2953240 RepID=A0ABT1PQT5_9ACTN|nr:APC family permease [Streptomyces humicola]MCQ4080040.1 APC family permease [Streptomyces humicola]